MFFEIFTLPETNLSRTLKNGLVDFDEIVSLFLPFGVSKSPIFQGLKSNFQLRGKTGYSSVLPSGKLT